MLLQFHSADNSNTDKRQAVSLSVMPNCSEKVVDHVAFAFVYGYNKNTMTVYSAMLNIAAVGYAVADESSTDPTTTVGTTEPTTEEPDEFGKILSIQDQMGSKNKYGEKILIVMRVDKKRALTSFNILTFRIDTQWFHLETRNPY